MAVLRMILIIIFLIAAFAVTIVVLLQEGKSAGLGSIGGAGNSDSYWDKNKKHSLEGKFERWTKIMAGLLVITAFILMFIPAKQAPQVNVPIESTITEDTTDKTTEAPATEGETPAATDAVETPEVTPTE